MVESIEIQNEVIGKIVWELPEELIETLNTRGILIDNKDIEKKLSTFLAIVINMILYPSTAQLFSCKIDKFLKESLMTVVSL